jgi:hypothetical protein
MTIDTYEEGPIKAKIMTGKRGRPPIRQVGRYQRIGNVVTLYVKGRQPTDKELCKMFPRLSRNIARLP